MTDKEKILAEIESLKTPFKKDVEDGCFPTYYCAMQDIEDFINYLPEEPVSEDLEEAAQSYADKHPTCGLAKKTFIEGAKWDKEKLIKKACEWWEKNDSYAVPTNVQIERFKQAMEE